ncbi:hypothetical protein V3G39_08115 [Dermatophilaceae bacterium Sec6.4]
MNTQLAADADTAGAVPQGTSRRSVAKGIAWSVPVLAIGSTIPAFAASACVTTTTVYTTDQTVTIPKGATGVIVTVIGASGGAKGSTPATGRVGVETFTVSGPTTQDLGFSFGLAAGGTKGTGGAAGGGGGETVVTVTGNGVFLGQLNAAGGNGKGNPTSGAGETKSTVPGNIGSSTPSKKSPTETNGNGNGATVTVMYCGAAPTAK